MKIIEKRKIWFSISGLLVVASLVSWFVWGLKFGIDFTGGSLTEIQFEESVEIANVRSLLDEIGIGGQVQETGETSVLIRTRDLSEPEHQALLDGLEASIGSFEEMRFDSIGPVIGQELRTSAVSGIAVVLVLIALYVAFAFRKVSRPVASWKDGVLTVVASFHDVLITVGVFSVLGHFYGWEVGTAFVAAALTVLGYSINDTVVVFDRIRENLGNRLSGSFEDVVDLSVRQTIKRSLYTTFTTLLALVAIFLFGGETTRSFAFALIVGIGVGAYSSIFLASPLLVFWEKFKK